MMHKDSRIESRILLLDVHQALHREVNRGVVPRDERQVRNGRLSPNEPAAVLGLGQHRVEHGEDAEGLLLVALDRGRDLLRVEADEPEGLAEVRATSQVL